MGRRLDSSFEEAFPLRNSSNRFIGASMPSYLPPVPSAVESISLLTSSASSLTVTVSPPQGNQLIASGSEGYKTRRLQTRLEQAIFFGTHEVENPFAFDLQPDYEGDLATAALAVSAGILASRACDPLPHLYSGAIMSHVVVALLQVQATCQRFWICASSLPTVSSGRKRSSNSSTRTDCWEK